jgi:hypothetical protein
MKSYLSSGLLLVLTLAITNTLAQDTDSSADEMARALQDPLANIFGVMTDNDVLFKTGKDNDDVSYSFQIQPVKAFSFDEQGFNFIARGVVPILGVAPTATVPPQIDQPVMDTSRVWGLSDVVTQFFFSPKTDDAWKWGAGPMISWKTRTDAAITGAGWGAGLAGVAAGSFTETLSGAFIVGHMWGDEGSFNTSTVQPMIYYNFPKISGFSLSYNATTSYNWDATRSGDKLTVPIGAGVSKTFALSNGYGIDVGGGLYVNAKKPAGAADWRMNWAVNFLFP